MHAALFSPLLLTPADALRFWRGETCVAGAQDDAWTLSQSGPALNMPAVQRATAARVLRAAMLVQAAAPLATGPVLTEVKALLTALSHTEAPVRLSPALGALLAEAAGRCAAQILQSAVADSDAALNADAPLVLRFAGGGLRRFRGGRFDHGAGPLLLVPALVNGPQLLHLSPAQSLAAALAEQGFRVYLWDWQAGSQPPRTRDEAVTALASGMQQLAQAQGVPLSLLGVCQGAWLAMWAAARVPRERLARLFLAAVPGGRAAGPAADPLGGWLPAAFACSPANTMTDSLWPPGALNRAFLHLQPFRQRLLKYLQLALSETPDLPAFLALEHWLFASPHLSTHLQSECAARIWAEGGPDLSDVSLALPLHWLLARRDHLVPAEAAQRVAARLPNTASVDLFDAGHIGLFVGRARSALAARIAAENAPAA